MGCPAHWWMSGEKASKGPKEGNKGKDEPEAEKEEGHALSLGSAVHKLRCKSGLDNGLPCALVDVRWKGKQ